MHRQSEFLQDDEYLSYAHDVVHGFSALSWTISDALRIAELPLSQLQEEDLDDLRDYILTLRCEVEAQAFEAWNWLSHRAPAFAGSLQRPRILRISPMEVLESMIPSYVARNRDRSIQIRVEGHKGDEQMPRIEIEELSVRRMFHNILSNVTKYSYRGVSETSRYIRVWCQRHDAAGKHWVIHFQNYGVGICEGELNKVFEPGYRGELARKDNTAGAGLGLSEIRKCIERHGGKVSLRSSLQHGETYLTTTSIVFPLFTSIRRFCEHGDSLDR